MCTTLIQNSITIIMSQKKVVFLFLLLGVMGFSVAQKKIPLIHASSKTVDIKEGDILRKGIWTISPDVSPDVYMTSAREITFYTDKSSISFKINPKVGVYDFIILLNGKDSARTQIKYQPTKLEILKQASRYANRDSIPVPVFTYQSMTDSNLVRIRQKFKLDSVAGSGNEISKILNVLHWVHNSVRHDGNSSNPTHKNASDLMTVCRVENRGINCRMMATILNECYLSLGFKSRHVTCMPKELKFDDCHVINMVYSNDLEKWVWVDPTFDAYVMNEKGELLGLSEVRERLIAHKPLILNPDANWNREVSQTKEQYLHFYMAKNLYRLQCPVSSEYDYETIEEGKSQLYLELVPQDSSEQQVTQSTNKDTDFGTSGKSRNKYYTTSNPQLFWAKP